MLLTDKEIKELYNKHPNPNHVGTPTEVHLSVVGNPTREEVMEELYKFQEAISNGDIVPKRLDFGDLNLRKAKNIGLEKHGI